MLDRCSRRRAAQSMRVPTFRWVHRPTRDPRASHPPGVLCATPAQWRGRSPGVNGAGSSSWRRGWGSSVVPGEGFGAKESPTPYDAGGSVVSGSGSVSQGSVVALAALAAPAVVAALAPAALALALRGGRPRLRRSAALPLSM